MTQFARYFVGLWRDIIIVLSDVTIQLGDFKVDLWGILMAFLIISIAITVFWKGGRG